MLNGQGSGAADLEGPEKLRRGHKSDCHCLFITREQTELFEIIIFFILSWFIQYYRYQETG